MKNNLLCLFLAIQFAAAAPALGALKSVAVVNFTNHTGGIGLQYLSRSLAESISATLAQSKDIRVVERGQLGRLIDEIALEQTGLFDEKMVSRAGKMARADVLILGSFTGTPEDIVLSLKAVDISSGSIIDGKVIHAPLSKLFDLANQAALSMAAFIAGKNIGYLSVSTVPDGADIYIDGMQAGQSPLVEYRLPAGSHRLRAVKSGYLDAEGTVTVETGKRMSWNPYMVESRVKNRTEIGAGAMYFAPTNKDLDKAPLFLVSFGQSFDRFILSAEAGYSRINHNQTFQSAFDVEITQERYYNYFTMQGHLAFIPFPEMDIIQPYVGIFAGWGNLQDIRKNASKNNDEEKLSTQNMLNLGLKAGFAIIPYSKISLFIEGRFIYTPKKVTRTVYESQGIVGDLVPRDTHYYFNAFTVGGGIKYYLD